MAVYFVTGRLGGGKTLISISKIVEYLDAGRPVATNIDLFFDKYPTSYTTKRPNCVRLPDQPSSKDLLDLGYGNTSPDEEKNGLLVFDECGTWFNSHGWNSPDRKEFVDVLLHIRKLGWDVIFIVQHFDLVDKQCRQALCQFLVTCIRLDSISIPFLSFFTKALTGKSFPMPRVHIGKVMYGYDSQAIKADRWVYRGTELYDFYDTKQIFSPRYEHGMYSYLKPGNFHHDKQTILKAKKDYTKRSLQRLWHLRPPILFFFILGIITTVTFRGLFSWYGSMTEEEIAEIDSTNPQVQEEEAKRVEFEVIRLAGIFKLGDDTKYFFTRFGQPYEPATDGFAYMPNGNCGATLVKDGRYQHVSCSASDEL